MLGTTRHRFDDKWRLVLPSGHREVIGANVYVAPGDQGQVVLFAEAAFHQRMAEKSELQRSGSDGMKAYLSFTKSANSTKFDANGRVVLPEQFRKSMSQDVVAIGAGDRVELWSAELYREFFGEDA